MQISKSRHHPGKFETWKGNGVKKREDESKRERVKT